jgi:hypothetical protein
LVKHLLRIFSVLWERIVKGPVGSLIKGQLHRAIGQGRKEGVDLVNQPVA